MDEVIQLKLDEAPALQSAKRANTAIDGIERRAGSAQKAMQSTVERAAGATVEIVDRSQRSIDRLVANAERKASTVGKSGVERLAMEREALVNKLGGQRDRIERVNSAYEKLIAHEEQLAKNGPGLEEALSSPWETGRTAVLDFIKGVGPVGIAVTAVGVAVGALGKKMFDLAAWAGDAAGATVDLGVRLGLTVKQAQELEKVTFVTGTNPELLAGATKNLLAVMQEQSTAGDKVRRGMDELGVSYMNTAGEAREVGEVTMELIDRLSRIENVNDRLTLANRTLGKSAKELLPAIDGYREVREQLEGVGVSADKLGRLDKLSDRISALGYAWKIFRQELSAKIEPILLPIVVRLTGIVAGKTGEPDPKQPLGALSQREWAAQLAAAKEQAQKQIDLSAVSSRLTIGDPGAILRERAGSVARSDKRQESFIATELRDLEGISSKLNELQGKRAELASKLRTRGQLDDPGRALLEREYFSLNREISGLEARKKAMEEAAKKAEDRLRLAAQGREELDRRILLRRQPGLPFGADFKDTTGRTRTVGSGSLIGTPFEVKADDSELTKRAEAQLRIYTERLREEKQFQDETSKIELDTIDKTFAAQESANQRLRQLELARLGQASSDDLTAQLSLEEKKLQIEVQFLDRQYALQKSSIARRQAQELEYLEWLKVQRPDDEEAINDRIRALNRKTAQEAFEREAEWQDEIDSLRLESTNRQVKLVDDANRKMRQSFDSAFDGIFNALLGRGGSAMQQLWNLTQSIFIIPFRDELKDLAASIFLPGAQRSSRSGSGGLLGFLGGFGGFGGLGAVSRPGAPGGTGGFAGPVVGLGGITGGRSLAGLGPMAGVAGLTAFLTRFGNWGYGPKGGDFGGEVAGSYRGVGGLKGAGMLAAGGVLAFDGLRRGGIVGLAETTAGGALIGAKFGGGIGALIGGAIGLGAGLVRLFISGAEKKVIEKVNRYYGYDIDKPFAKNLLALAKESFGGDLDRMLFSQQAKDLIELWAMSTGKSTAQFANARPQTINLSSSNGVIRQIPNYYNGSALPTLLPSALPGVSSPASITLGLQLDGKTTRQLMTEGTLHTMARDPRAVQAASIEAQKQNSGRSEQLRAILAPTAVRA